MSAKLDWIGSSNRKVPRKRNLEDEQVIEIKDRLLAGEHQVDIAASMGIREGVIERIRWGLTYTSVGPSLYDKLHRRAGAPAGNGQPISEDTIFEVYRLLRDPSLTHEQIAQTVGISRPTVTDLANARTHQNLYWKWQRRQENK